MKFRSVTLREMILFFLCIFLAFFLLKNQLENNPDNLLSNFTHYNPSAQIDSISVNGNNTDISYNQSMVLETKKQLESVLAKNDTLIKLLSKFKKIASTTVINNYTTINNDTILRSNTPDSLTYSFSNTCDSYSVTARVPRSHDYLIIDSLVIPNKQSIIIGEKKLGFMKGTERRVEIVNSNPLIKTDKISSFVIQKPKRFYETNGFKFGMGVLAGGAAYWRLSK